MFADSMDPAGGFQSRLPTKSRCRGVLYARLEDGDQQRTTTNTIVVDRLHSTALVGVNSVAGGK